VVNKDFQSLDTVQSVTTNAVLYPTDGIPSVVLKALCIISLLTYEWRVTFLFHGVIDKLQSRLCSLLGYYRHVADVVIVPWRISGFVCSGPAVTEWEWDYKPL